MRATAGVITLLGCIAQFSAASQAGAQLPAENTVASAAASPSPAPGAAAKTAAPVLHSVKLVWNASAAASKSPQDAVIGYKVYRSTKPHDRAARVLNEKPVTKAEYTDSTVEPGRTYYYVTKAVSAKGVESNASNEAKVSVPDPLKAPRH